MVICYACSTAAAKLTWLLLVLLTMIQVLRGQAQPPNGFLSIDCGLTNRSAYNMSGLQFVSDDSYIDGGHGTNHEMAAELTALATNEQEKTLRSFPIGRRNCYTLPTNSGKRYLIRTTFSYGNYDQLNKTSDGSLFLFGLHIGANLWATVNLTMSGDPTSTLWKEIVTVAADSYISVCLVNLGSGTPFVSALEMRLLGDSMYPFVNASVSASYFSRLRFGLGPADGYITRYPNDTFDRFWEKFMKSSYPWINLKTSDELSSLPGNDDCQVPSAILQRGTTIAGNFTWLNISIAATTSLDPVGGGLQLMPIFHFAELNGSRPNRQFDIYSDSVRLFANYSPQRYRVDTAYHKGQFLRTSRTTFTLREVNGSELPPLINAFEVYSLVRMENSTTASNDVNNMNKVKMHYKIERITWNGDPCSPREYSWEGLTCDYSYQNPRITQINLAANGLQGGLHVSFMNMTSLKNLDLSHNNLTGVIPEYQLNSLQIIDLSHNKLDGPIPGSILQRYEAGLLDLRIQGNPLCSKVRSGYCANKKNTQHNLLVAVIVPLVSFLVLAMLFIIWKLYWKGKAGDNHDDYSMYEEETPLHIDIRRFTFAELKFISNNFQTIVGKGGFGIVYHGILENGDEVAIKVLMETSLAESKDFLPEVQTLSKVHHKNLVALEGYCQNKKCLALVYGFMPRGNLQQLLQGGNGYILDWEERLHIALDAAQGLEYLHESCIPSIVHRDVKTANILLDQNLVAKISDFGLSRSFNAATTHISTVAAGTLGYLDPEYHATFQLTVKTDVYSFGIVLLEIMTGQPPVFMDPQTVHLPNWVRQKIAIGSIQDIVDNKLLDQYDATTMTSIVDLAMNCVENASIDRPTMTEVVSRIKAFLPPSSDKQPVFPSPRKKNVMDADIPRQFQLMISGASSISNEGSSFQSGYIDRISEISHFSGR